MLPNIKLDLNSVQLFEAQARTGAKLKEFEEVKKLDEADYNKFIGLLRDYSQMLQMEIMRNYAAKEKKEETRAPQAPKQKEEEYYGTVLPKDEALKKFKENYVKCFGCEPKKIA